ncbi:MAG: lipocalin family protein [Massilia sp.]
MKKLLLASLLVLSGCLGKPDNVTPVTHFDASRYLGTWYEVARLDHSFERGLSNVTANYSVRPDGGLKVVNRGYRAASAEWKESDGKAFFVEQPDLAYLKVSFFGPMYGSYVVFDLDQQAYQYAMISGPNKSYLWILSRTPTLDETIKKRLVDKAQALGFDTAKLIYVSQAPVSR